MTSGSGGGMMGVEWLFADNASFYLEYNALLSDNTNGFDLRNQGIMGITFYF